jgi:hypothetical protein
VDSTVANVVQLKARPHSIHTADHEEAPISACTHSNPLGKRLLVTSILTCVTIPEYDSVPPRPLSPISTIKEQEIFKSNYHISAFFSAYIIWANETVIN